MPVADGGEGTVEALRGKPPRCRPSLRRRGRPLRRVRRVGPSGTVPPGLFPELVAFSGDPGRAREDLVELGEKLGRALAARGA
jgi:hypothetical protein